MRKTTNAVLAVLLGAALCFTAACGTANENAGEAKASSAETAAQTKSEEAAAESPEVTEKPEVTKRPAPAKTAEPTPEVTEEPAVTEGSPEEAAEVTETPEAQPETEGQPEEQPSGEEAPAPETQPEALPETQPETEVPVEEQPSGEEATAPETPPAAEEAVGMDPGWEFADHTRINSGAAILYRAQGDRKNIVVGVNAGHGTSGGGSVYTLCHPDGSAKTTGGTTGAGATEAIAVSSGMTFHDGTPERDVNLDVALIFKDQLLANGYDVLMIRNGEDVQLDNIARTVLCNNLANCHIAIHFDGDGLDYDKGCFYMAVADGIKGMYPVSEIWTEHDRLGESLIAGLSSAGCAIMPGGSIQQDLTQTSYSKVPSVDIELGNAASDHSPEANAQRAAGLLAGVNAFFGF